MQYITSRKSRNMILFLSCPFQKWTWIWPLPSTSHLSVTLWAAASVAHKSNICWRFWVIWEYEYWHEQCLEAVFEVSVTTVEVEIVLELIWGKLSLFSFQHVIHYRRTVSHEWTVILWLYEIHAESRREEWSQHEPIHSAPNHELLQTNTSFTELSRHRPLNKTK